ncbi:DUF359 domain-containing protein [Candidatus Micrarchaeota archaeon]|nr:DUF359 domain-containing protein [Candidatus Micrarchaeota archaeon]
MHITEELRYELKKPLGELLSIDSFLEKYKKKKIIAVGDIVLLSLLEKGLEPFIAVYDFKSMRKDLPLNLQEIIKNKYHDPLIAKNPAGEITDDLQNSVKKILKTGGALFVEGEEDLASLVFMNLNLKDGIIIYGQPNEGVVAVIMNEETRKKAVNLFRKIV